MLVLRVGKKVEVVCPHHNEPVEALVLQRLDEPFRVGVEIRRAVGQADWGHAGVPQRHVEGPPEIRVAVAREDSGSVWDRRAFDT